MSTPLPQVLCHFCGENMWVSASQGPRIEVFSDRTDVICPRCDAVHVGLPSPDPKTTVVGELRGGRRSRLIRIPGDEERRLACPRCWDRRDVADRGNAYRFGRYLKAGMVRFGHEFVAVRGERLALIRLEAATADPSPGAPRDEMLQVVGLDNEGRIAEQVWFDIDDMDAAIAELDAAHARLEEQHPRTPLENAASK